MSYGGICRWGNNGDNAAHFSPDCESGKHRGCHGDAWCFIEDAATSCDCRCHESFTRRENAA